VDKGFLLRAGREVPLRPKVFEVLGHLVLNHGTLVSKDALVAAVWSDAAVTDNSLAQCLFEIRRALGDEAQTMVRTVARRGYVFTAPVSALVEEPPTGEPTTVVTEPAGGESTDVLGSTVPVSVASEAEQAPASLSPGLQTETNSSRLRHRWMLVTGLGLALTVGIYTLLSPRGDSASRAPEPAVRLTDFNDSAGSPSLSHDGRMLAFVRGGFFGTVAAPRGQVYVKMLPDGTPIQLTSDTSSKAHPVFSPDNARIIYTSLRSGLSWDSWQVPVLRGTPMPFLKNASGVMWLSDRRLVYSTIMSGTHMGIATSTEIQSDYQELYFPTRADGMAHRTTPSPDGKWLLIVEMTGGTWQPCRLVPSDGSTGGSPVSPPNGQCTTAAWSPDGRWMYFSSNAGGAFHVWRQRFPDGEPEQITFGPTEQEGTAVTSDGQYLITSMGLQQASIWLHGDGKDRQLTVEGYATQPTMDPAGRRLYYMARSQESRGQTSGDLWSVDLESGDRRRVVPSMVIANYSLSHDGGTLLFTTSGHDSGDGVWVTSLTEQAPPRRLVRGRDLRAFFGAGGEVIYTGEDSRLYRMNVGGAGITAVSDKHVAYLSAVSPDGRWAVVIRAAAGGTAFTALEFMSLRGEPSFTVCNDDCSVGPRSFLVSPPFAWNRDGSRMLVNLIHFGKSTPRSVWLPYRSDASPEALWPKGLRFEKDVLASPGATAVNAGHTFPGPTQAAYLSSRGSTLSNLYRIRIPDPR
jgi:DNA-binding winged helix-turn-helix (wHTH) protein/Tol biopolymer transport system component